MTITRNLYQRFQHYRTLRTDHISTLPIVILMPHSACNCRCVMCDIWKGNHRLKQLTEADLETLLISLKKFGTRQVVMSGGEALLNPNFFLLCDLLLKQKIQISLLTTGITLAKHAEQLVSSVTDIIVSLDGDEVMHNKIRNIANAFAKLQEGVQRVKSIQHDFPVTSRTVIHRINFRAWPALIEAGLHMGIDRLSFLPADVSSSAFNREIPWSGERQQDLLIKANELPELDEIISRVISCYCSPGNKYISESPEKLRRIYEYYAAYHGLNDFPYKKCNAPWVSTVVEADGTVRPCFFHAPLGNIHDHSLEDILNNDESIGFRKQLNIASDPICQKCVCSLNYRM